jgi:hypothetical protein
LVLPHRGGSRKLRANCTGDKKDFTSRTPEIAIDEELEAAAADEEPAAAIEGWSSKFRRCTTSSPARV